MALKDIEAHLIALGITPLGDQFEPITADTWRWVEDETGGRSPTLSAGSSRDLAGSALSKASFTPTLSAEKTPWSAGS